MIRCETKMDHQTMKAFQYNNLKKSSLVLLLIETMFLIITVIIFATGDISKALCYLGVTIIFPIIVIIVSFIVINVNVKKMDPNLIISYTFSDLISCVVKSSTEASSFSFNYDSIINAKDYGDYLYLFTTNKIAYIINKASFTLGSYSDLIELLKSKNIIIK